MLQNHFEKPPLTYEPFTTVRIRLAVALVARDYRQNPAAYSFPPLGIYQLGERLRHDLPSLNLFSELVFVSKAVEAGHRLAQIAWLPREQVMRSLKKTRVLPRRS